MKTHNPETKICRIGRQWKRITSFLLPLLVLIIWAPFQAWGQVAQIQDILINSQGERIIVYARVTDCFTKDMESAILAGVPTTFTFLAELYQERSGWLDKKVASVTVSHTVKYDSVRKIFWLFSSGDRDPAIFQDMEGAKRAMAEFNGVAIAKRDLRRDLSYYIMMKAKLDKVRLPLYMEYVFFFVSLWDFETNWYRRAVIL